MPNNFISSIEITMLKSLSEAKIFAVRRVIELTGEEIEETEKAIIETGLENEFLDKISEEISDEEIEKANLGTPEAVEGYLFHKLPNYMTLLEETTAEFL